jgi:Kef-type K+ transport system membrane component KefB
LPDLKLLFLQLALILVAAKLAAAACRLMGQPAVIGEMAAGILLGPSLLGRVAPGAMNNLFPSASLDSLHTFSQVGLVLFMFLVGLEVPTSAIRGFGKSVVFTSVASVAAPFLCGGAMAWELYPHLGAGASPLPFTLFLGAAMSITAFPVLARILKDRKLINTRVGIFAISCAAVDDVTAWCLLAIITVIAGPGASNFPLPLKFTALGLYVLAMLFLIRPALRRRPPSAPQGLMWFGLATILLLSSVWVAEALAVHALFGAFLAGIVMPKGGKLELALRNRIESLTVALLLPVFFAYSGLRTNVGLLNGVEDWLLCSLILFVAVASKLLVSATCVRASGMPWRESLAVGVLVNTRGLVELVILNIGLDLRIISPTLFSMMVIMALATTLMTTPLLDRILPTFRLVEPTIS